MPSKKYYAVITDSLTDISESWDACRKFMEGKKCIKYKSFSTKEEAVAFISGRDIYSENLQKDLDNGYIAAYTDGSFYEGEGAYTYGVCILDGKGETLLSGKGNNPDFLTARNVAGEIEGVLAALDYAVSFGYKKIKIYHDYNGLSLWASGEWGSKSPASSYYISELNKYSGILDYDFVKVKGHSNNAYNEKVDKVAKAALFENKLLPITGGYSYILSGVCDSVVDGILTEIRKQSIKSDVKVKTDTNYTEYIISSLDEILTIRHYGNGKLLGFSKGGFLYQVFVCSAYVIGGQYGFDTAYRLKFEKTLDNERIATLLSVGQGYLNTYNGDFSALLFPILTALNIFIKTQLSSSGVTFSKITDLFTLTETEAVFNKDYGVKEKIKTEQAFNIYRLYRPLIRTATFNKGEYEEFLQKVSNLNIR